MIHFSQSACPAEYEGTLDNCLLYLLAVLHTESRLGLDIGPQVGLRIYCSFLPAVAVKDLDKGLLELLKLTMDKILHVLWTTMLEVLNDKNSKTRRSGHHG